MNVRAMCSSLLLVGCVAEEPATDEYVFGLSADEVLATKRLTTKPFTDGEWLEINRGPFSCTRHTVGLCDVVPPASAAEVVELGYRLAIAGASAEDIAAAQDTAIDEARAANPDYNGIRRDSSVQIFTNGSTSWRLRMEAWAISTVFSGELKTKGECKVQHKVGLSWFVASANCIGGQLDATWTGGFTTMYTDNNGGLCNGETASFGPEQRTGTSLTTTLYCSAIKDSWSASGTVVESKSI